MDQLKKFRLFFWLTFGVLVLAIMAGSYYLIHLANLNGWKEEVIAGKNQKIALQAVDLAKQAKLLKDSSSQTAKNKDTLAAENTQLKQDKESLITENNKLKANQAQALAYNEVFKYVNSVIETHNGFDGWTDAEFQIGKTRAEATGNTAYVSTINWAWYDRSVAQLTRALRFWKETAANIETSLK